MKKLEKNVNFSSAFLTHTLSVAHDIGMVHFMKGLLLLFNMQPVSCR